MAPHLPWSRFKSKAPAAITTPSQDGVSPLTSNEDLANTAAHKSVPAPVPATTTATTTATATGAATGTRTPLLNDDDEQFLERLLSSHGGGHVGAQLDEGPRPPLPPRTKTPDLVWDSDTESFHLFDNLAPNPNDRALILANQNTELAVIPKAEDSAPPVTAPAAAATTAASPSSTTTPDEAKEKEKEKENENQKDKKPSRLSRLFSRAKKPSEKTNLEVPSSSSAAAAGATPAGVSEEASTEKEWADLSRILDRLSLASDGTSAKVSAVSSEAKDLLVKPFLQILKDLANGVPTAADDLVQLLDGRNDVLSKNFQKLPSSLQKLVTQLPKKLTSSLAPEILAAAAEAQGRSKDGAAASGGNLKDAAKGMLPKSLNDLVLTPAIIKTMLKAIVNALKTRFPAFMGTAAGLNVLWSLAVFLLLFVLWYCHKRGKEEREKKEKGEEGEEGEDVKAEEVVETVLQGARADGAGNQEQNQLVVVSPPPEDGVVIVTTK